MATINMRVGDGAALPEVARAATFILSRVFDAKKTPFTQAGSDVIQMFDIPAGTFVDWVVAKCERVEGSAGNTDTGDAADTDGYGVDLNVNALGSACSRGNALATGTPNTYVPAYGGGKYYSAAGVISFLPSISLAAAKLKAVVKCDDTNQLAGVI